MADMQPVSLGKRLRRERENRHWTHDQLAKQIGCGIASINRWEHDRATPHPHMLGLLVKAFDKPHERWGSGFWNIPYLRNRYFTGRDLILQTLHDTFFTEKKETLNQICAISGLGGIGKTQTAIEYAYRYANEYEDVLWIQADSHEALVSNFAKLAILFDLPEKSERDQRLMTTAVKQWLQDHSSWLLILDNVDELGVVSDFLPRRRVGGAILLTSRSQITGQYIKRLPLEKMSQEEGITFLLRRIATSGHEEAESSQGKVDREQPAAQELWKVMDGLPLALDQAGAFIEAKQSSLSEYVNLYRDHRQELLRERGEPIPAYSHPVATTWSLSFDRVKQKNLAAAELLQLCAFFSPDAIPEELITNGAVHFKSSFRAPITSDKSLFDAIKTLNTYSLIQRNPDEKTLSIHPLVQAVLQDSLQETERRIWAERALLVVNVVYPEAEHKTWPQSERLLTQALTVTQGIERYQIVSIEAGHLLSKIAAYLQDRSRYAEAEPLLQRALQIYEQQLGPQHLVVATLLNNLANLYMIRGNYAQTEPLLQRALHIYEQQPEHIEITDTLHCLANLYITQGKYELAKPPLRQELHILERQLGPEHVKMAAPQNNLAILYKHLGEYTEAEPLFKSALAIWERQLGPEHPNVAYAHSNLGVLYLETGDYEQAKMLFLRAQQIWEQQQELEHIGIAYPLDGLANLYREQGKYELAEPLLQQARQILEQQLGTEHTDVAELLKSMANLYRDQGRYAEAKPLYLQALQIREKVLGCEKPETATIMFDLAQLWEAQGDSKEASDLYGRALAVFEQTFDVSHPKTREIRKRFSALLHTVRQHEEAIRHEAVQPEQRTSKEEQKMYPEE